MHVRSHSNPFECLMLLVHCFHGVHVSHCKSCSATACQTWLLELMGHIKNIAMKMIPVVGLEIQEVLQFLLLVFSAAVCSWSGCSSAQLLLAPIQLPNVGQHQTPDILRRNLLDGQEESVLKSLLMINLSPALVVMCSGEGWPQMSGKIIDWLLTLCSSPGLVGQERLKHWIKDCLFALKHTKEFRKMTVWGRAFSL
ncbi:hypothetical protein LSH36_267g02035 [Paralvinella palmiformis]|uniref:Focadhesin C-terminal domain-containing protein n=1 Tax=Paralvinella palmiformis TaxID=53620 RepID=A0AAD9N4Z6_9ANNE|nr:hypothetical protein LSH36_267g02035 [Paralvinella palmiformis]